MTALERVVAELPRQQQAWGDYWNTGLMYDGMYREAKRQWFLTHEFLPPESLAQHIDAYLWLAVFSICIADYLSLQIPPPSP